MSHVFAWENSLRTYTQIEVEYGLSTNINECLVYNLNLLVTEVPKTKGPFTVSVEFSVSVTLIAM